MILFLSVNSLNLLQRKIYLNNYLPLDTMILGIDVVFIHTRDPEKLRDWYKDILDLEIGFATPNLHWQEFSFPQEIASRFGLDFAGNNPSEVEKQKIMISFKVKDIYSIVEKLESKGIEFFGKNKINDAGPSLFATFQDIEGNWIQMSQRK